MTVPSGCGVVRAHSRAASCRSRSRRRRVCVAIGRCPATKHKDFRRGQTRRPPAGSRRDVLRGFGSLCAAAPEDFVIARCRRLGLRVGWAPSCAASCLLRGSSRRGCSAIGRRPAAKHRDFLRSQIRRLRAGSHRDFLRGFGFLYAASPEDFVIAGGVVPPRFLRRSGNRFGGVHAACASVVTRKRQGCHRARVYKETPEGSALKRSGHGRPRSDWCPTPCARRHGRRRICSVFRR